MKTIVKSSILTLLAVFMLGFNSYGMTTYTSNSDGDFMDPTTWTPNGTPDAGDDVIINHDITLSNVRTISSLTINNNQGFTSQLSLLMNGDLTVNRNIAVSMNPSIPKYAELIMADGSNLHVLGNIFYTRDNESEFSCRLYMTGGVATVDGNFTFTYLTGGYNDGTTDHPENITEINLQGSAILDVAGAMLLYQDDSPSLTTFQYILQVRTEGSSQLNVGSLLMQNDTDISQYNPQIHLESWDNSKVKILGDLTMNQYGAASDLVRFESENNSSFTVGGDVVIDKQSGRSILFELYDSSVGSIANNLSVTKTNGTSNIAVRAKGNSTFNINGTTGLTKIDNGGTGSFGFDVEAGASVLIPNGGFDLQTNGASPGPTYVTINGMLSVGKNMNLVMHDKLLTFTIDGVSANLSVGSNFTIQNLDNTSNNSGLYLTDGILSVDGDFSVTQNSVFNNRTFFLEMDGAFDAQIGGNLLIDDQKGTMSFLIGSVVAGSTGGLNIDGNLTLLHSASASTSSITTEMHGNTSISVTGDAKLSIMAAFSSANLNHVSVFDKAQWANNGDIIVESYRDSNISMDFINDSRLIVASNVNRTYDYGNFNFKDQSSIEFNGSSAQIMPATQLVGAGTDVIKYNNVIINNSSASMPQLTLESDVEINGSLNFIAGIIKTNNTNKIIFKDGAVCNGANNSAFIDGPIHKEGTSDFQFPTGDINGTDVKWAPVSFSGITGGDASLIISAEYNIALPPDALSLEAGVSAVSAVEYWDAGPITPHTIEADVSIFWKDAEFSGISDITAVPQDAIFMHYNGTLWENLLGTINPTSTVGPGGTGDITAHMTSFSPITFGSGQGNNPLPVTLTNFAASLNNNIVTLTWRTESEVDNNHFEVQKSIDGKEFTRIATIQGHGTTSEPHDYRHTDRPGTGINYYRLKQIDNDGTFHFSKIVSVENHGMVAPSPVVYPNPVAHENTSLVNIDLTPELAIIGSEIQVSLLGPNGNIVLKKKLIYNGESIVLDLAGKNLNKGVHFLVVSSASNQYQTKLFVE